MDLRTARTTELFVSVYIYVYMVVVVSFSISVCMCASFTNRMRLGKTRVAQLGTMGKIYPIPPVHQKPPKTLTVVDGTYAKKRSGL